MTQCSKPACTSPAAVVLSYDYATSTAVLSDPAPGGVDPHLYGMCATCADKLTPPLGWVLEDKREEPPLFLTRPKSAVTVEVLDGVGDQIGLPDPEPQPEDVSVVRRVFFGHSA